MAQIPDAAVNLIKKFEGRRLEAYPDPGSANGLPITIGYGSTRRPDGSPFKLGDTLTAEEADALLIWDLENRFLPPQERIPAWATMDDNQKGAILSFAYNLGAAFYGNSDFTTITRVLNEEAWDQIEAALVLYRNRNTSVETGLLKRRLAEAEVFLKAVDGQYVSAPGQQFLGNVLTQPNSYFDGLKGPFEPGQRTISLTNPFMFGDDIKVMQQALADKGYDIEVDGYFGPMSEGILETFQQDNSLVSDGIVGPMTWANVLSKPEPEPTDPNPTDPGPTDPIVDTGDPVDPVPPIDIIDIPDSPDLEGPTEADEEPVPTGPLTVLKIIQDTVFKLRPEEISQLNDTEQQAIPSGKTYILQSYAYADPIAGNFNGHLKIALKQETIRGLNTWFVPGRHVQVEFEGEQVYPWEEQQVTFKLRVYRDTVFKRCPMPSSELPETEKVAVPKGSRYYLHSYAYQDAHGDFSSHIKIAIKDQQDFLKGLSQWYVYDKHAYVEYDGNIVYPSAPVLQFTQETIIKRRPVQSSTLPTGEKYQISAGKSFILDSWAHQDSQGRSFNRHIKFALKLESDFIEKTSTWYVYDQHAQITWNNKVLYPPFGGKPFKLPGNETTFYTQQPIFEGSDFTWGEATKDGTRLPATPEIVNNIITLAKVLQEARKRVGHPFVINSWYRDPQSNTAVGGATGSLHLQGRAVDMEVPGYSVRQVANAIMSSWPGGILIYSTHLHLDNGRKQVLFL